MRWKSNAQYDKKDQCWKRTKRRFLLFPKWIGGTYRWLEYAEWLEEYPNFLNEHEYSTWEAVKWLN